ncbi:MAG TPA: hypothetical protein VLF66_13140 [Thermoanaerobaculia bacterium]|nr:hypothetical protein [Thermoanaerobaculia bacterium]
MGAALIAGLCLIAGAAPAAAQARSVDQEVEELRREIQELRRELEALREGRAAEPGTPATEPAAPPADRPDRLSELERRIEVLAAELERLELGEVAIRAEEGVYGLGPAASKVYRRDEGLSIGGYGEMLYQNFDSERDDGSPSGSKDTFDFLRAIVYFGYKFNDKFLLNTEIEIEHANEAFVEFAYLDYLWRPEANLRAGLVLVPMGFVNELHEPTIFLGARRPDVEQVIIPTTWRENGFGLFGEAGQLSYRTYVVNGLRGENFSAGGLRGGRQKGSSALAEDLAWVGRLDWTPTPGVLIGGSAYVGGSGQGLQDPAGGTVGLDTTILEGHAEWRWRGLELRALYATAELDDVAGLNRAKGLTGAASVGEELSGYYLQAGYDVLAKVSSERQLIPYVRFEAYDTQEAVPAGFARNPATDVESLTVGLAFKPIDQIVLKADYQDYDNGAGTATDRFNVALGYIF